MSAEFAVALPAVLLVVAFLLAGFKLSIAGENDIRALTSYALAASRGESQELLDDWAQKHLGDYRVTFYIEESSLCAKAHSRTGVSRSIERCVWVGDY